MTTIHTSKHGMPIGVYGILYYTVRADGSLARQAACDSGLSARGVDLAIATLGADECLVARCESQPGGCTAYGSAAAARRAGERAASDRKARIDAASSEWSESGATIRVHSPDDRTVAVTIDGSTRRYRPDQLVAAPECANHVHAVWSKIRDRAEVGAGVALRWHDPQLARGLLDPLGLRDLEPLVLSCVAHAGPTRGQTYLFQYTLTGETSPRRLSLDGGDHDQGAWLPVRAVRPRVDGASRKERAHGQAGEEGREGARAADLPQVQVGMVGHPETRVTH